MRQLSIIFDVLDEPQSQYTEKADMEKQSNLSSNITAGNAASESLMLSQWRTLKKQYPDALLLFRAGDFYEIYNEDAKTACRILGVTLVHRDNTDFVSCGFPFHNLDEYLPKLVRAGFRVAICDQIQDRAQLKSLQKNKNINKQTI